MTTIHNCCHCGSEETLYCESRGETYCTRCGLVLEENHIVDSISFTETASGVVKSVGQFVPTNGFSLTYESGEIIRELTLQKGYGSIKRISDRLKLRTSLSDAAQRIYLMSVQRGFTTGRTNQHVAAACLYISCRREKSPYMLIDFSDVLMTPVKVLGRTFVKMLKTLRIRVPTIDPSLFMERFVGQMTEVSSKAHEIAHTGVRLVQAMTRDWIATGRRPTGLCGAALLIAARIHGFKINPEDVSSIIRMASSTIRKRLNEFRKTSTAQLKNSEFESMDLTKLPIITRPPCVMAAEAKQSKAASCAAKRHAVRPESGLLYDRLIPLPASTEEICNRYPSGQALYDLAQRVVLAVAAEVKDCDKVVESPDTCSTQDTLSHESLTDVLTAVKKQSNLFIDSSIQEKSDCEVLKSSFSDNESEGLSDVSDTEINWILLDEKEKEAKALIWDDVMKEIMPEVHRRNCERHRSRKADNVDSNEHSHTSKKRRKQCLDAQHFSEPADSVRSAFQQKSAALARRLDDDVLRSLFILPEVPRPCLVQDSPSMKISSNCGEALTIPTEEFNYDQLFA